MFGDDGVDEALVSIRRGEHSASAILVVDQQGQVLASVWHDGQIDALGWLSDVRMIVAAGVNSEVHAHQCVGAQWEEYDGDPLVVFGVTVDRGTHGWIITEIASGTVPPTFYDCLRPLDTARCLEVERIAVDRHGSARVWLVPENDMGVDQGRSSIPFVLHPAGVGSLGSVGDAYPDSLPHPATFSWADLPLRKPGVQAGGRERESH